MSTTTQNLGKVGLVDHGVYSQTKEYNRLDFVTDENNISTYLSLVDKNVGNPLTDTTKWRFLAKGVANTPQEALDLILQADGPESGLDADTLDGTQLEEIVNPEELASASPFDYFLGAKEVDGKWVFKKMAPTEVATVVAGEIGPASSSSTGLITDKVYNNAVPSRIYWEQGLQRNQTVLVASIPAYDLVELNVSMGTVEYALKNNVNASCKILINNRTSEGQVSVVKIDILNSMDVYWKMNGNLVDVYIKATTGSYNYCTAVCQSSVLGVAKNKIIKLEISDNDVSLMNVAGAYYPNVFGYTNLDSLSTGVAGFINFPFTYRNETQDANTALESGIYRIYGSAANAPTGNYGILITFNAAQYILQVTADVGNSNAKIYIRTRNSNGVWSSWKEL